MRVLLEKSACIGIRVYIGDLGLTVTSRQGHKDYKAWLDSDSLLRLFTAMARQQSFSHRTCEGTWHLHRRIGRRARCSKLQEIVQLIGQFHPGDLSDVIKSCHSCFFGPICFPNGGVENSNGIDMLIAISF